MLPKWPQSNAKMIALANEVYALNGYGNFGKMTGSFDVRVKSGVAIYIDIIGNILLHWLFNRVSFTCFERLA